MNPYDLKKSEKDVENYLKANWKVMESKDDCEISQTQYMYIKVMKDYFHGLSVYQDGEHWKVHVERITFADRELAAFDEIYPSLKSCAKVEVELSEIGKIYLDLMSEEVFHSYCFVENIGPPSFCIIWVSCSIDP